MTTINVETASASGANPTATASDVAVNGVATTFMRSDAAPAVQKTSSSVFGLCKVDNTTITASGGVITAIPGGGGVGNVTGPASSTDTAIATWNGTAGTALRNNSATAIDASGNISTTGKFTATGNVTGGNLTAGGLISATGNVSGGNLSTAGLITATGNITGGNLTTAGNVTGANIGNITPINLNGNGSTVLLGNGTFGAISSGNSIYPSFTTPVNGDFAWVNQGGATITVNSNGSLSLNVPANSGVNIRLRKKSTPATPYTITAAFIINLVNVNYQTGGLMLRQSSDDKVIAYCLERDSGNTAFKIDRFNTTTSFNSTTLDLLAFSGNSLVYLRLTDNGTNRLFSYSMNGIDFIQIHSEGRTSFLTADEVGFYGDDETNTYAMTTCLYSWLQT